MTIHLEPPLPEASRDLPGQWAGKDPGPKPVPPLFGLAPGGVCRAATVAGHAVRSYRTVSPLLRIVRERFNFCGTFPGVAPAGRYPAPFFRGARTFLPRTLSGLAGAVIQPTDAPDLFPPAAKVNKNRPSTNSSARVISWREKARYERGHACTPVHRPCR